MTGKGDRKLRPASAPPPSPALAADAHMVAAKHRVSMAALACKRGALDADAQVQAALQEIEAARTALREVDDER